jgi:hypothetical protein
MPQVQELSAEELDGRRAEILRQAGLSYVELASRAEARSLVGDEWAAWEEIREIDFLRNQ